MRMSMTYCMIVLSLLCGCLLLGREPEESIEVINGEWTETGNVKKLYDTPLGAVYRFSLSNSYTCSPYSSVGDSTRLVKHKKDCQCDFCKKRKNGITSILQFNLGKGRLKYKRFVVLDFKVRAFPALDDTKSAEYQFQIVRSGESKLRSDYGDVNGILRLRSNRLCWTNTTFRQPADFWKVETKNNYYNPNYEPHSFRVIFDTKTGENLTVIRNGYSMIYENPEAPITRNSPIEIKTLGIIAQNRGGNSKYRRQILEFSPPTVYRFNSSELLNSLPEMTVAQYPYSDYTLGDSKKRLISADDEWRQLRNHKNPDLQYAYALRLLYGDNPRPSRAVELLERAVREDHALANYQLGLCYYRGYGVEPDDRKADQYLEVAERYGYQPANTLRALLLWNQKKRPRFVQGKSWEKQLAKALYLWTDYDCHAHDPHALTVIFYNMQNLRLLETSPKCLGLFHWLAQYTIANKNLPDPATPVLEELDKLIQSGYRPACLTKAMFLQHLNAPAGEIAEPLRRGAHSGDPECEVMLLETEARLKKLDASIFTPEKQLSLGEYPQYLLLSYALKNPNFPGIAEFLRFEKDHAGARQIWERTDKPEAGYLLGLLDWTVAFPYSKMHGAIPDEKLTMKSDKRIKAGDSGFKRLKEAARRGVPEAMYLIARQYCRGDFPADDVFQDEKRAMQEGRNLMTRAAAAGQLNARFAMLELALNDEDVSINKMPQYLEEMKEFVTLNYVPALLLKARILDKMKRKEAVEAYQIAAKKGAYEALRLLAVRAAEQKQMEAADALWGEYMKADREFRKQDRYDVFYPSIQIDLQAKLSGETRNEEQMKFPKSKDEYQKMIEEE